MNTVYWMLLGAGLLALVLWGARTLWRYYNSPDAERYRRTAMQGPFTPLSEADLAADEARKHGRAQHGEP
jgi:hypothetical protein